jgi:integrase
MGKFSVKKIESLKKIGYHADGDNLYLQVSSSNAKSWIFRFSFDGKRREMGIGSYPEITLEKARESAIELRRLVKSGVDPIEQRKADQAAKRAERSNTVSFEFCASNYIDAHRHGWKNAKHAQQWANTLEQYAYPVIGEMPVKEIDTTHVLRILEPIWTTKTETASRVRSRLENVMDWATTRGYRSGDNPARWKGHLENLLPKSSKVKKVSHHAALPYQQMNEFICGLRQYDGVSAMALEFLILTAARTGEVIGAMWKEIDLTSKIWTVPAERRKAEREHRVPLSPRCIEILERAALIRQSDFVFPGGRAGNGLSNIAMVKFLQKSLGYDCTVHGFRSSFRDWAGERTNYPRDLCEMALAHTIKDKAEAAYRRGDMLEKRRQMMADWLKFCETASDAAGADIVPIRKKG